MDCEKVYKVLFNAITTAINQMEESRVSSMPIEDGLQTLKNAQQENGRYLYERKIKMARCNFTATHHFLFFLEKIE